MKDMAFKKRKNYQKDFLLVIEKISKLCEKKNQNQNQIKDGRTELLPCI